MKRIKGFRLFLLALAVIGLLAGCNFVFSSSVSVRVTGDSSDSSFGSDVYVFAFTDKSARDNAYQEIVDAGKGEGDFGDYLYTLFPDGCYQVQVAEYISSSGNPLLPSGSGTVATFTIRWNTSSPEFGEDYDRAEAYFIAATSDSTGDYAGKTDYMLVSGGKNSTVLRIQNVNEITLDE